MADAGAGRPVHCRAERLRQRTAGAARHDFTPLLATPARLAAAQLSPESRFEGLTGAQVEARTRALADVQVGHFQGVPSGWLARPVRIYFRVYAHKNKARGGIVLVPGFTEGLAHHQ